MNTAAPADAIARPAWSLWKKVLAYALLAAAASTAIWYVDLKAHRPPGEQQGDRADRSVK